MGEDTARWHGPLPLERRRPTLRFGVHLPSGIAPQTLDAARQKALEAQRKPEPPPEQLRQTMRDWVATDRYTPNESLQRQAWRHFIALLPCVGFLWLAWQCPFGRRDVWLPASAAVAVLGLFSLWYLGYVSLRWATQGLLTPLVNLGLNAVGAIDDSRFTLALREASVHAFLVLALGVVMLSPAYFRSIASSFARVQSTPSLAPGRLRKCLQATRFMGRLVWGTLWGGAFAVVLVWGVRYQWDNETWEWLHSMVQQQRAFTASEINDLFVILRDSDLQLVSVAVLALLLLLAAGVRAWLFGLGVLLVVLRFVQPPQGALKMIEEETKLFSLVGYVPWGVVIPFAALLALLFVAQLLGRLLPSPQRTLQRGRLRATAAGLIGLSLALPFLPAKVVLVASSVVLLTAVVGMLVRGTQDLEPVRPLATWCVTRPRRIVLIGGLLALVVAWPIPEPTSLLKFRHLFDLLSIYNGIFVLLATVVFFLLLKDYDEQRPAGSYVLEEPVLSAAAVLFALFVVQSPGTWVFIPVSSLVAWLIAKFWLVRRAPALAPLEPLLAEPAPQRKARIAGALAALKAQSQLDLIEKALEKSSRRLNCRLRTMSKSSAVTAITSAGGRPRPQGAFYPRMWICSLLSRARLRGQQPCVLRGWVRS